MRNSGDDAYETMLSWCPGEDLNLHVHTDTST